MNRVLFLDCDGVVNSERADWEHMAPWPLEERCAAEVDRIVAATGAEIVISSVWRNGNEAPKVLAARWPVTGKTPNVNHGKVRADEIRAWLAAHPDVTRWAVLDDDADADLGDGSFFRTTFADGLTPEIADRAIAWLRATAPHPGRTA